MRFKRTLFETLRVLTIRQRMLWRYSLLLEREGANLKVHFSPRQPNDLTDQEDAEFPRQAWDTYVVVDPHTFKVVRFYLAAD